MGREMFVILLSLMVTSTVLYGWVAHTIRRER